MNKVRSTVSTFVRENLFCSYSKPIFAFTDIFGFTRVEHLFVIRLGDFRAGIRNSVLPNASDRLIKNTDETPDRRCRNDARVRTHAAFISCFRVAVVVGVRLSSETLYSSSTDVINNRNNRCSSSFDPPDKPIRLFRYARITRFS